MKTKFKTIFIIMLAVMLITMFTTSVNATYSAVVTMSPDKTEVSPGDTITVAINLTEVTDAGTGASEMAGYVQYDKNFIESISATQGTWATNEATGMFLLSGNILTTDGEFAVLQFKVSENATGSSTVHFTEIITTDGTAEPSSPDIDLTFTIKEEENPGNDNPSDNPSDDSNNNNNPSDNDNPSDDENTAGDDENTTEKDNNIGGGTSIGDKNNGTNTQGNKVTNSIKGNTLNNVSTQTKLPYTGIGKGFIIVGVILVITIVGFYLSYKKYQKV